MRRVLKSITSILKLYLEATVEYWNSQNEQALSKVFAPKSFISSSLFNVVFSANSGNAERTPEPEPQQLESRWFWENSTKCILRAFNI